MADPHQPASRAPGDLMRHYVGDLVYGANDGIITTFTVVSGVAGARLSPGIVIVMGLVNLLADGFSMGASNYLSIRSLAAAEGRDRGRQEPLAHALVTFAAFVIAGLAPLVSYLVPALRSQAFLASAAASAAALFGVGASRCLVTSKSAFRCGSEMLLVGASAASVAFLAGRILSGMVS